VRPLGSFLRLPGFVEGLEVEILDIPGLGPRNEVLEIRGGISRRRYCATALNTGAGPAGLAEHNSLRLHRGLQARENEIEMAHCLIERHTVEVRIDIRENHIGLVDHARVLQ